MRRRLLLLALGCAVASIGLAFAAHAEAPYGGAGSGEQVLSCACHDTIEAADANQCAILHLACTANACTASGDAACPNGICVSAAVTGCPTNQCFVQDADCNTNCPNASAIGNVVLCYLVIPTLDQWGLIAFGLMLLTAMFVVLRQRRLPSHIAAGMLILIGVGLAGVVTSYAAIQSQRTCSDTDVAVEFVHELLEG